MALLWSGRYVRPKLNKLSINYEDDVHDEDDLACAAGGTWVRVLYCFIGGAASRVGIRSLFMAAPPPKKFRGHKNPAS